MRDDILAAPEVAKLDNLPIGGRELTVHPKVPFSGRPRTRFGKAGELVALSELPL
jgi:hypothetical protein